MAQAFVEIMLEDKERIPAEGDVGIASDGEAIIYVVVAGAGAGAP